VAVPLVSILLNLLSVGAPYGLITLIFQDGRLAGLLGFTSYGAIVPWIPLFLFVFLFGLSMDYHVLHPGRPVADPAEDARRGPGRGRVIDATVVRGILVPATGQAAVPERASRPTVLR